jgi:hypothetical protein
MILADLAPNLHPELSLQHLSPQQTWAVLGGVRRGCAVTRVVRAIDVTSAIRDQQSDFPQASRAAAIHIGLWPFLFASKSTLSQLQRQIITAEAPLLSQGYTHFLITGPFVGEAIRRDRMKPVYAFRNHAWYAVAFSWLYHLVISVRLLVPLGLTDIRKANLKHKRVNARTGFGLSILFKLQKVPPKP